MAKVNRRAALVVSLLIVSLLIATVGGCNLASGPEDDEPQLEERELRLLVNWSAPMVMSPLVNWPDSLSNPAVSLIFGSLFFVGEEGQMRPYLAEELAVDDGDVVVHMRDDLLWHDGESVTASDIEFTLQTMLHPDFDGGAAGEFDFIDGAEEYRQGESDEISGLSVEDEKTLRLRLNPDVPLIPWSLASLSPVPAHRLGEVSPAQLYDFLRDEDPVGAGPYVHQGTEDSPVGIRVQLGSHDEFFYPDESISRVEIDLTGEIADVKWQGDYDGLYVPAREAHQQLEEPAGFTAYHLLPPGFDYLGMNHRNPVLQLPKVREAVRLAVDEEEVIGQIFGDAGKVVSGPTDYAGSVVDSTGRFDRQEANRLLDEADLLPGDDRWRRTDQGEPIELYLAYPSGDDLRRQAAEMIGGQLAEVGLEVIAAPVQRDMLLYNIHGRGIFDMYLLAMDWHRSTSYSYWQRDNPWGYRELDLQPSTSETVKRFFGDMPGDALRWESAVIEDTPVVFVGSRRGVLVISEQLGGVIPWQFPSLGDIFSWNWPKQQDSGF